MTGVRHVDHFKTEFLFSGVPSSFTSLWIDMALYSHVTFFIGVSNPGSGITTSAVTVNQGQTVAGNNSKALVFNNFFSGVGGFAAQTAASDVLTQTTGVSGTFNTATTVSTKFLYVIEVHDTDLDMGTNASVGASNIVPFNAIQLAISTGGGSVFSVFAHCFPRFGANFAIMPSALT
jgi:hypothetical protein